MGIPNVFLAFNKYALFDNKENISIMTSKQVILNEIRTGKMHTNSNQVETWGSYLILYNILNLLRAVQNIV